MAEAELLRIKGIKYDPDLVILIFEYNDFGEKNNDILYSDPPRIFGVSSGWLFKRSQLFRLLVVRFNFLGLRFHLDPDYRMSSHIQEIENSVEKGIARMAALARNCNFELIVAVWPRFPKPSPAQPVLADFCETPGQCARLEEIRRICETAGLDLYNMAGFFVRDYSRLTASVALSQNPPSLKKTYTIGDGGHPNSYGAKIAAEGLLEILYRRNFLPSVYDRE